MSRLRVGAEVEAQQRLGVGRAHVEVPVVVVHGDAVEVALLAVGEPLLDARQRGRDVVDGRVDLAADEVLGAQRLEQLGHGRLLLREQLEDEQRRDEAGVGVVVVGEVVVAGHLAAEQPALAAHALLEEGVPDAVEQRHAAVGGDHVRHGAAGAQVVEDLRARVLEQQRLGEQRGDEVAGHELAVLVDEEAAVGVAVPGDAEVGLLGHHALADLAAVLLEQRVGRVVGERPVDLEVHLDAVEGGAGEHQRRQLAGDAVGGVHDDLVRAERGDVDEPVQVLDVGRVEVEALAAGAGAARRQLGERLAALLELGDAGVAAQRQRALPDQLHAVVLRRVVRGGDHGAAVQPPRGDAEVQHLRGHEAEVDGRGAGRGGAGGEGLEQPGGRGARVHARAEPGRAQLLRQGAADALGGGLVELLRVQPADVVGLEDAVGDRHVPSLPRSCS